MAIMCCQTLTIFFIKRRWSENFSKELNFLEKIVHCLENANIPFPSKDWAAEKGTVEEHFHRMKSCSKEGFLVILTNFVYNCILLVPIFVLGNYNC